jgi:hypothetical protein
MLGVDYSKGEQAAFMKQVKGFEKYRAGYKARLRILKDIIDADSQQAIADKLGIEMKRWNNYERGYPIPREIAFLLREKLPGMSAEWLWFGDTGNLSPQFIKKIKEVQTNGEARAKAIKELEEAEKKLAKLGGKRRRPGNPVRI